MLYCCSLSLSFSLPSIFSWQFLGELLGNAAAAAAVATVDPIPTPSPLNRGSQTSEPLRLTSAHDRGSSGGGSAESAPAAVAAAAAAAALPWGACGALAALAALSGAPVPSFARPPPRSFPGFRQNGGSGGGVDGGGVDGGHRGDRGSADNGATKLRAGTDGGTDDDVKGGHDGDEIEASATATHGHSDRSRHCGALAAAGVHGEVRADTSRS